MKGAGSGCSLSRLSSSSMRILRRWGIRTVVLVGRGKMEMHRGNHRPAIGTGKRVPILEDDARRSGEDASQDVEDGGIGDVMDVRYAVGEGGEVAFQGVDDAFRR